MLIIRRKAGESILVGDDIEILVMDLSPGQVRLGIRAPTDVVVLRKEIWLAREQNRAAARAVPEKLLRNLIAHYRNGDGTS